MKATQIAVPGPSIEEGAWLFAPDDEIDGAAYYCSDAQWVLA